MVGFLNSHGSMPRCFEGRFVDLTSALEFDDEFDNRRGCPLDTLLCDPFAEPEAEEPDDDDFIIDFDDSPATNTPYPVMTLMDRFDAGLLSLEERLDYIYFETPHDEDLMDPVTWVQTHYAKVIAAMEPDIIPTEPQPALKPSKARTATVVREILPMPAQSCNNHEPSARRTEWRWTRPGHNRGRKLSKWHIDGRKRSRKSPRRWSRRQYWKDYLTFLANTDHLGAALEMEMRN